jgi:shikimate kinase
MGADSRTALLSEIWARVDPRLRAELTEELAAELERADGRVDAVGRRIVLVGQRAAGKSWLLEPIARLAGRPGFDLDREIEAREGRRIAEWLPSDEAGFRAAERRCFATLPISSVVAAGGGFLSLHADLLADHVAVLVPLTFDTHVERLRAELEGPHHGSPRRPRLRPDLTHEEELHEVFFVREALHRRVPTVSLPTFLKALVASGQT